MQANERVRKEFIDIVNNQINDNDPPETKITFNRLLKDGYNDFEAKQLIAQCVAVEIFEVIKNGKEYDNARYIRNLKKLPGAPFED